MVWLKMVHLLALGLWVGASAFFSFFTALPIIARMKTLAATPGNWLSLTDEKQGVRVAGEALEAVFARYFVFQAVCGAVALLTALIWLNAGGWTNKLRVVLLGAALALACINLFYLAPRIHDARLRRYDANPETAKAGEAAFGPLHTYSLFADLATLACAAAALALAAYLPGEPPKP